MHQEIAVTNEEVNTHRGISNLEPSHQPVFESSSQPIFGHSIHDPTRGSGRPSDESETLQLLSGQFAKDSIPSHEKKCRIFLQHNSTRTLPLSIPTAPARMEAPVCFSRCAGVWPGGVFAKGVWLGVPSGVCPGDTRGGVIAIAISWQRKLGCMVPTSP